MQNESHRRGGQAGIAIQQRDDGRHVGAADGDDQQNAEEQRDADDQREKLLCVGMQHQENRAADGDREQQEVDEILSLIGDGPLRQDFLQLSRGHQAAGEGEAAKNDFHGEHRHHEL